MGFISTVVLPIIAIAVGVFIYAEYSLDVDQREIEVIKSSDVIEGLLAEFKEVVGEDYDGYRGHLYRVLSYTNYYLKGVTSYRKVIETALVYHDIGLWTDGELSYLEPSTDRAVKRFGNEFTEEETTLMINIIMQHHKFLPFSGPHEDIVNAVRKADWIDASHGILKKGISETNVRKVESSIPNAGFHKTLANFGPKLHGANAFKIVWEISGIFRL